MQLTLGDGVRLRVGGLPFEPFELFDLGRTFSCQSLNPFPIGFIPREPFRQSG